MLKTGMKDLQPLSASHLHLKTPPLLTGRRQAQALRGRRGGLRALRRQRTKPAGQRDPFERCARSWPCPPSLLHSNLPAVQCHDVTFELLRAKLEGERNCRPAHASATCAYCHDQNHELTPPRLLAQAVGPTCARSLGDFHGWRCASALARPVRACAQQRTALPIPWVGPGLAAGLGGSTCTARAAAREQVWLSAHMTCPCPLPAARGAHSVCHPSQVAICAPSGAIQTSLVALAQLCVQMRMGRACMRAVHGLRHAYARTAVRMCPCRVVHA